MLPPIRVQSYALILVIDRSTQVVKAASSNAQALCSIPAADLVGRPLGLLIGPEVIREMQEAVSESFPSVVPLPDTEGWPEDKYQMITYTVGEELVIEIEPRRTWPHSGDYSARINDFTEELEKQPDRDSLLQNLCDGLVYHFGYDRAIVMQFDNNNDGLVTQESRQSDTDSLLHVRFVEADIPPSTRKNQLAEAVLNYNRESAPLETMVGSHSERTWEVLRRCIAAREPNTYTDKYLRDNNLCTLGHLSLIVEGKLWGSVYMHAREPVHVDYQMRVYLRVVGRIVQQKISYHLYHRSLRMKQRTNAVRDRLHQQILGAENLASGLTHGNSTLLNLVPYATAATICSEDKLTLFGNCPRPKEIYQLIKWLKGEIGTTDLWYTDHLSALYPPAKELVSQAAGMLFLPLDPKADQWIIWFRPEQVQAISYGSVAAPHDPSVREFRVNEQTCHECSEPWSDDDLGTIQALQDYLQGMAIERYAGTRRHNNLLREAVQDLEMFSYTIGHDLRAPLRGISNYAEVLEEDFGHLIGDEGLGHLDVIRRSADRMRIFMDDLLALSHIDRSKMTVASHSVPDLVQRVLEDLSHSLDGKPGCTVMHGIPEIAGDKHQMHTVFTNLLSNAFKYSSQRENPRVEVGFTGDYIGGNPVFFVADNGIGIPPDQQDRMFELFTRSTNSGGFAGTGIGLALVHRIIRFHEGEVWIESKVGEGTRMLFYTGVRAA